MGGDSEMRMHAYASRNMLYPITSNSQAGRIAFCKAEVATKSRARSGPAGLRMKTQQASRPRIRRTVREHLETFILAAKRDRVLL